MILSWLKT